MTWSKNVAIFLIILAIQGIMAVTGYNVIDQVDEMVKEKIDQGHRVLDEIIRTGPPVVSTSRWSYPEEDEDEETKRERQQWKHLSDCKNSLRPERECDVYYEQNLLKKEDLISRLKYYHKLWNKIVYYNIDLNTAPEKAIFEWKDLQERARNMEPDLYPWLDIHEKCMKMNLSNNQCYDLVNNVQSSQHKEHRYTIMAAEAYLCTMSGKAEEDCKLEALGIIKQKEEL